MNFERRTIRLKIPEYLGGKPKGAETLGKKLRTISVYLARLSYQAGLLIMNFREMLFHSRLEVSGSSYRNFSSRRKRPWLEFPPLEFC